MGEKNVATERKSINQRISTIWQNITVEPLLAFYVIPSALSMLAVQNLNIEKACRVNLAYSKEICDALSRRDTLNYTNEEKMVQEVVASMANWRPIITSGIPFLLILFWGSWSDRHRRRKPCILFPICGEILAAVGLMLCTYFEKAPMEVAGLTEALCTALSGGWTTMFMGIFSYVADITAEENRTVRIGIANLCFSLGVPIGMAFSGILLKLIGFYGIFSITASLQFCALMYGIFYVKEPKLSGEVRKIDEVTERKSLLADFFDKKHVLQTFKVAFKNNAKQRRWQILTLFIVFIVVDGPLHGEMTVFYLFVRYRFNWGEMEYSIFSTYAMITNFIGTSLSISLLTHKLKVDDAMVGVLSSMSKIIASFLYAFAVTDWQMYLAPILEMLNGTSFIAMRSIGTKLVGPDEFGKINSLFGVVSSLVPLIYTPLYASVYIAALNILPGAVFLLGAAMTVPAVFIFLWMYKTSKRESPANASELEAMSPNGRGIDVEEKLRPLNGDSKLNLKC